MSEVPGVDAAAPHRIPARGWGAVLRRAGRRVMADRLPLLAAGVAFFALLSIAPVLVTALSIYGAVNTPAEAVEQLSGAAGVLPPEVQEVVGEQLTSVTAASTQVLTVRGLTALLLALWTATAAATYLIDALTLAYLEDETRSALRRSGMALALVLGGAAVLAGVLTALGVLAGWAARAPASLRAAAGTGAWVVLALLMVGTLAVLYRIGPDRKRARWSWVSEGAVVATALWVAASLALFAWVRALGTYATTYGSLAGVAISMLWIWTTVLLVLVGAVVNAEAERQTARDSTVGPERPLGQRMAVVADSAPPYPDDG